ncbi:MAG TPA: YegS/Rv2252/BmrU family lipid kinase, partial [Flavisolibacter sp.]|nr:YegS/Rv2252/BmrU family lipid kinase [Flavisolibacter sp.]
PRFFMLYSDKHIALICNPTAGNEKALHITDSIAVLLTGLDIKHSIFTAYWPTVFDSFTDVWIIGGDGTLNWFINQYPGIQLPLSVFAGGTGNDFHWMLYGDLPLEKQVEFLLENRPQKIDAGICNGKLFLNGVGIGFDGAVVRDLLGKKKLAGKASYLLSILKHIVGYQEKACALQMPDETIFQECFMISVANARRYGGGFHVAPKASLKDGLLDVNIVGEISPLKRIRYLPVIEKGEHMGLPFIQYRHTSKIKVSSKVSLHAHMDGEYFNDADFEIELLPKHFSFIY